MSWLSAAKRGASESGLTRICNSAADILPKLVLLHWGAHRKREAVRCAFRSSAQVEEGEPCFEVTVAGQGVDIGLAVTGGAGVCACSKARRT